MNLRVEIVEMGWDLCIKAQSRRALSMNSVWLRKEVDGDKRGTDTEFRGRGKENLAPNVMDHDLKDVALVREEGKKRGDNGELALVSDLIDSTNKKWKTEIITTTFQRDIAQKILQVPLARTDCEDMQVWKEEHSVNLRYKRVVTNASCPRCYSAEEDGYHVFRQCPTSINRYKETDPIILLHLMGYLGLTKSVGPREEVHIRKGSMLVHERKFISGRDLSHKIQSYLIELEGVREKKLTSTPVRSQGQGGVELRESIQFDAAFDISNSRSASGIVARDQNGEIKVSKSTLHFNVSSPFVAEAYACLEATKLENLEAHNLAKDALRKGEERYLVGETIEESALEERWPQNPD
ncbi:hypothetical protein GOBAR_DD30329 [Gossypium barbadense]|nr:hypothetical protein GOBAR_DD30329 [Gossypium barbadense]